MLLDLLFWWPKTTVLGLLFLGNLGYLVVTRIYLHRLKHVPGEFLAALTQWHWHYHAPDSDYLVNLHARFGPVVRIAPNQLHFSDPVAYSDIYHSGSKFTKDPQFYAAFGANNCSSCLINPRDAKIRKDILSPLFSKQAIRTLESTVQQQIDKFLSQILTQKEWPVDISHAVASLTLDIISEYCFAQSYAALEYPNFRHPLLIAMDKALEGIWLTNAFPFMLTIMTKLPTRIAMWLNPSFKDYLSVRLKVAAQIDGLLKDPGLLEKTEHETIYHHLLAKQPDKEKYIIPNKRSLLEEALNLIFGGSDTTGNAVSFTTFHVLNDREIYNRLIKELDEMWPEKDMAVDHEVLEKLPYLTAVIKEGLRMSHGLVSPLPRVVGPDSAIIGGISVPAGTIVSMAPPFVHNNTCIFPNPQTFTPDRWLQPDSGDLDKYLVAFSKGPRSCLGINLAWCELYLILGHLFRKVHMEIHDTSAEDFSQYKACFLPIFTGRDFHVRISARER